MSAIDLVALEGLAGEIGARILTEAKTIAGAEWDRLSPQLRADVERATRRIARLELDRLRGVDVTQDLLVLEAILLSLASVAGKTFARAVGQGTLRVLEASGAGVRAVLLGALGFRS